MQEETVSSTRNTVGTNWNRPKARSEMYRKCIVRWKIVRTSVRKRVVVRYEIYEASVIIQWEVL